VESLRSARPPLGLNKAASSVEESCVLAAGEAVLLYTDGLYEMQNATGERLGHEALAALLPRPSREQEATEWLDIVIDKATEYAGSVAFPDDIAAFAAVYKG